MSNLGLDVSAFFDPRVIVFTRALMRSRPLNPHIKAINGLPMLRKIITHCDRLYLGTVYKAAFLLSFFSFLRTSNLVPYCISSVDPLRQLARGDIIFAPPEALILKWSKTPQNWDKIKVLKIPSLNHPILCPVSALKNPLKSTPGCKNLP